MKLSGIRSMTLNNFWLLAFSPKQDIVFENQKVFKFYSFFLQSHLVIYSSFIIT